MTVLEQPSSNPRDRTVRWRQLVDLVARAGGQVDSPLVQQALALIRADRLQVPEPLRAAAARAIAALPLPAALVGLFASDRLAVSAPVLAAARLQTAEWAQILSLTDTESRNFIASLHPELPIRPVEFERRSEPRPRPPVTLPPRQPTERPAVALPDSRPAEKPASSAPPPVTPVAPPRAAPPPVEAPPVQPPRTEPVRADPPAAEPPAIEPPPPEPTAPAFNPPPRPSRPAFSPPIADVVERLERLRRAAPPPALEPEPALPPAESALFRWECDPSGEIAWVEGAPRGPLIGRSIARVEDGGGITSDVERAFGLRAPFRDSAFAVAGEGALAGQWKISGFPAFDPADGRFRGYRGVALRDVADRSHRPGQADDALSDPDALRDLVHELKTPLNAIIGFAEIIDGQYLGPADHRYRTRAAEIVAQARLLLAAIDDLDFAAKLRADRGRPGSGTDLARLIDQIAATLRQGASGDAPQLDILVEGRPHRCALEPALAERLITRFCTALLGAADDRERVELHLDSRPGTCLLWAQRPGNLGPGRGDSSGPGFGLRLVGGLARIAGGDLRTDDRITLTLPEL
ncbi:MAG: histidine kinase dimerization/phospho-acceptor domain-containing protein [Sphingomicrobium sp.]